MVKYLVETVSLNLKVNFFTMTNFWVPFQASTDTEVVPVGIQAMEPMPSSSSRNLYSDQTASSSGSNMVAFGVQAVEPAPSSSGRNKHFKKRHQVEVR